MTVAAARNELGAENRAATAPSRPTLDTRPAAPDHVDSRGSSSSFRQGVVNRATNHCEEAHMRYLLLIYNEEPAEMPPAEVLADQSAAYDAFTRDIRDRGLFLAGEALHPTSSATTVRVRDGQTVATDGPFAETKEALGGFYMISADDLDQAIELAAKIPGAKHGSIEVRPIFEYGAAEGSAGEAVGAAG